MPRFLFSSAGVRVSLKNGVPSSGASTSVYQWCQAMDVIL